MSARARARVTSAALRKKSRRPLDVSVLPSLSLSLVFASIARQIDRVVCKFAICVSACSSSRSCARDILYILYLSENMSGENGDCGARTDDRLILSLSLSTLAK